MKIKIIADVPLDLAHGLTKGKILEVTAESGEKLQVKTAKGFLVYLLPGEYEVVEEEEYELLP